MTAAEHYRILQTTRTVDLGLTAHNRTREAASKGRIPEAKLEYKF